MATLRARGLTLVAGERTLVRGLDLEVASGEVVALEGPSGAGKTTLLRALCLLDEPAAGEIQLDGRVPDSIPAFRRRVVYLAQRPVALGGTVRADLARAFSYQSARAPFDEEAARARLSRLGLEHALEQDPASLSEGERQRVCLARALAIEPAVLLLDEPTSALDAAFVAAVESELLAFVGAGGACVLVSHAAEQRARLATRSEAPFS